MIDKEKVLINIPADGNYIEILGYKIDGFESFEAFCEHLKKCAELEEENNRLKAEAKVKSKCTVMETMARCIETQEKEIERLKKLLVGRICLQSVFRQVALFVIHPNQRKKIISSKDRHRVGAMWKGARVDERP